jgi:hypothetical protein
LSDEELPARDHRREVNRQGEEGKAHMEMEEEYHRGEEGYREDEDRSQEEEEDHRGMEGHRRERESRKAHHREEEIVERRKSDPGDSDSDIETLDYEDVEQPEERENGLGLGDREEHGEVKDYTVDEDEEDVDEGDEVEEDEEDEDDRIESISPDVQVEVGASFLLTTSCQRGQLQKNVTLFYTATIKLVSCAIFMRCVLLNKF